MIKYTITKTLSFRGRPFDVQVYFFPPGRWYEIKALCLLFAGNCLKTNETEQTHYTSRSCDIIHARLMHAGCINLVRVNTAFMYHFNAYKRHFN